MPSSMRVSPETGRICSTPSEGITKERTQPCARSERITSVVGTPALAVRVSGAYSPLRAVMVTICRPSAVVAGPAPLGALGAVAFFVAWPVTRWLISRGRGHAVVHQYH